MSKQYNQHYTKLPWNCSPIELLMLWPAKSPLVMLHSGRYHPKQARWTIMAEPAGYLQHKHNKSHWVPTKPDYSCPVKHLSHNPMCDIQKAFSLQDYTYKAQKTLMPFTQGWIGCLSYDLGRVIETTAQFIGKSTSGKFNNSRFNDWPVFQLAWCPSLFVYDHKEKNWYQTGDTSALTELTLCEISNNYKIIRDKLMSYADNFSYELGNLIPDQPRNDVESTIARAINYIKAGDIFQANIAQAFKADFSGSTRALFINAMQTSTPWYGGYLELDHQSTIISLSPEMFLEVNPAYNTITTRPIKGTRPEQSSTSDLENSEKDTAELNMIVDLMRNDLGRVCEFGSVKVVEPRSIETHPTVQHGVATITGTLKDKIGLDDILKAAFPPGSITGAPKIRAMQIIDELEPQNRGPFFGSVGCFGNTGYINLNVAIRTMLISNNNQMQYMAGGGIVADSNPKEEYNESITKTKVVQNLVTHPHLMSTQSV